MKYAGKREKNTPKRRDTIAVGKISNTHPRGYGGYRARPPLGYMLRASRHKDARASTIYWYFVHHTEPHLEGRTP